MAEGKSREIRAVFFDLDGTLMDSEVLYVDAVRIALLRRGRLLAPEEALELVYGRGWHEIYQEIQERWPGAYPDREEMENVVREIFQELEEQRDIAIPGSVELLHRLAQEFPVAVVSGSPRADVRRCLDQLGVLGDLQFFLGAEDYPAGKPDPSCYLKAAGILGVLPETCLVFEDSTAGVAAAKGAGMLCVALQRPNAPRQDVALADLVLDDLGKFDLAAFLQRLSDRGSHASPTAMG
ncbi:MAG: sugar phosphatase [Acidobacteriota bacterium]